MAYQMKVDGMAEISETLSKLEQEAPKVAARALYKGAGIMAEEINKSAGQIRTAPFQYARDGRSRLPSPEEKAIVMSAAAGIAKFDKNGTEVNTSVGFRNSGYAQLGNKVKPIPQIVNAINSGTSFMTKQPFVRKAASSGGKKAMEAMKEAIEAEFSAMNKDNGGNKT